MCVSNVRFRISIFLQSLLIVAALLCAGSLCNPLWAQLSTTATITGTVTDESGAVVPDAAVTIVELMFTPPITQTIARSGNQVIINGAGGLPGAL